MSIQVFGLTGGVASGKSTVSARLREHGIEVIDADRIARDVVAPASRALAEVVAAFGDVLAADGTLDRKELGRIVFADLGARRRLEAILHPRIAEAAAQRIQELDSRGVALACYDAALLIEHGLQDAFRPLVLVAASRELQRERLMRRDGVDAHEAERRIDAQWPLERKTAVADFVIDNGSSVEALHSEVDRVLAAIRRRGGA
jgi:dephospho-CoA kinase